MSIIVEKALIQWLDENESDSSMQHNTTQSNEHNTTQHTKQEDSEKPQTFTKDEIEQIIDSRVTERLEIYQDQLKFKIEKEVEERIAAFFDKLNSPNTSDDDEPTTPEAVESPIAMPPRDDEPTTTADEVPSDDDAPNDDDVTPTGNDDVTLSTGDDENLEPLPEIPPTETNLKTTKASTQDKTSLTPPETLETAKSEGSDDEPEIIEDTNEAYLIRDCDGGYAVIPFNQLGDDSESEAIADWLENNPSEHSISEDNLENGGYSLEREVDADYSEDGEESAIATVEESAGLPDEVTSLRLAKYYNVAQNSLTNWRTGKNSPKKGKNEKIWKDIQANWDFDLSSKQWRKKH